jgi:D-glycero-D-manno-heptose 1,7-bisphosphate phosphatase
MKRPAIFLDRDGVLVEEVYYPESKEWEAPWRPEDVRLIPGAAQAAGMLSRAKFLLVLVSNQAAHAKGKTTLRQLWLVHQRFVGLLNNEGTTLDGVFYSYGHPNGIVPHFSGPSLDRKPNPYNLFVAAAQLDIDLQNSWMIGDRMTDVHCARAAGVAPILVENPHSPVRRAEDVTKMSDLVEAARFITSKSVGSMDSADL